MRKIEMTTKTPETIQASASLAGAGAASSERSANGIPRIVRPVWYKDVRRRDRLLNVVTPIFLLFLWELLTRLSVFDSRFFPAPSTIGNAFVTMLADGSLFGELSISAKRLFLGFVVGAVPGIVVGLSMGMSTIVKAILDPIISALMPVPKTVIIPLALLIFGLGETANIVMVAIGVFFPIAINAYAGVANIQPIYFDVAKSLRISKVTIFFSIAWPGALSTIFAGFQLAIANALIVLTVVEMLGATEGLGHMIWTSWQVYEVPRMYVGIVVISAAGVLLQICMKEVKRLLLRWDPAS